MNLQLSPLSPREEQVYTLWQEGKSNKEIAATLGITTDTVRSQKRYINKKNVHVFAPPKPPRAEHIQIQKKDLPGILSPLEYMVFLEMEKSHKNYSLIAKTIKTTEETVKKAVKRIKRKIGSDFSRLFEKGLDSEQEYLKHCGNCLRLKQKIHNNGSQTIVCLIHGQITYKSDEPHVCQDYKSYINKKYQERDLLEERLKDTGFLKIMFDRYACGNEPTSSEEMLKLGVNSVDCQDYLFKKRAQQLITMIQSAKYPVVMLTKEDLQKYSYKDEYIDEETLKKRKRTRYPIKEFLTNHRIKSLKTEHENDEEYTSYYVFKSQRLYQQFMTILFQETKISIPEEGTLQVEFNRKALLKNVYIEKDGQKEQIEVDIRRSAEIHTVTINCEHSNCKLILVVGESEKYSFTLYYNLIIKNNQTCQFKQVK